jgi:hypothetical protein
MDDVGDQEGARDSERRQHARAVLRDLLLLDEYETEQQ